MKLMRATAILITIALLACSIPGYSIGSNYSIWLRAHPQAIVADSYSTTVVSAEVRDSSGRAVPDGTVVDFSTSLGIIERSAQTTAGVARARLQSDTTIGTALVSAVVSRGNAVAQLRVDFLAPGTEMFDESFISIESPKHLGYDIAESVIDAAGGVSIYHRGINFEAESAQMDVRRNILRAKAKLGGDNIVIKRGDETLYASALYYDFNSMRGAILTPADEGAQRLFFRGNDMHTETPAEDAKATSFDFVPITEARMFIRARSIFIRPGEELKFKRATFYVEGRRVVNVPLYVISMNSGAGGVDRMLTYGTEGLRLDLPLYYSLTPSTTGAVRIKHSEPGGWGYYSGESGWQVDIQQEYNRGGSTEGQFTLDRVTSGDWGINWTQRHEFGDSSQLYTSFQFPEHRDLFGTADFSKPLGNYNLRINFRGNKTRDADMRYASYAYLQSNPKPLLNGAVNYALTTRLSYDSNLGKTYTNIDGTTSTTEKMGTGLGLQLYGRPLQFGANGSLSSSLTLSRDWGGSFPGTNVNANLGYYHYLGNAGQVGLAYSYSWSDSGIGYRSQRLSGDCYLRLSDKLSTSFYVTRYLNDSSTSIDAQLGYAFIPGWRLDLLGTYQKFGDYSYSDAEFALVKAIGAQEARLIWSQSRKKFRLEFSALSF